MKHVGFAIVLGLATVVAGCGKKQESTAAPQVNETAPPSEAMSADMGNMTMAPEAGASTMAQGTGTVTAIDKAAGTITLNHGPIPEAKWPAMTMTFKASPAILESIRIGDKVAFDLKLVGSGGEVTGIQKQ